MRYDYGTRQLRATGVSVYWSAGDPHIGLLETLRAFTAQYDDEGGLRVDAAANPVGAALGGASDRTS